MRTDAVANMVHGSSSTEELKKYITDVKFTLDVFEKSVLSYKFVHHKRSKLCYNIF